MNRRIIAILAAVALLFAFTAIVVSAGTQGGCAPSDTTKVRAYENDTGDTSDNDDQLYICGNIANLETVDHTLPGNCTDDFLGSGEWGDCINRAVVYLASGTRVCFWSLPNYGGSGVQVIGPRTAYTVNLPNDITSSVRFGTTSC